MSIELHVKFLGRIGSVADVSHTRQAGDAMAAEALGRAGGRQSGAIWPLALTAHALKGEWKRFPAEGFDDYIDKPIDTQKLDRVLTEVMDRQDKGQRCTAQPDRPDRG